MKKISGYLVNFDGPSAGFSEGKLRDDPGDGTGSGLTVQTGNDWLYAIIAPIIKYKGTLSDSSESETLSDMLDSIELAIGIQNININTYDNAITYTQDEHVIYLGIQYISMISGNLGNNPIDNPVKWIPAMDKNQALSKWRNGDIIMGGLEAIHNYRDSGYRQYFQFGKYNFGGFNGRNFQVTAVHLDGTQVTGNATLEDIFNVSLANEYHLLDIIAPEVLGIRTLLDTRARVPRIIDAISGLVSDVGSTDEDAAQRITGQIPSDWKSGAISSTGVFSENNGDIFRPTSGADQSKNINFDNANSISPNISKTNDDETRVKSWTDGVPYILVIEEI